jgi:hypothetical protein
MHIMKMESQSDREVLAGLVERVTYQNADNGFCVIRVKARGHRDLVTVVGHAAVISTGEWITAAGDWTNDRTHGQQFKARFLKTSAPTSAEGIEKYLGSGMIHRGYPRQAARRSGGPEESRRHRGTQRLWATPLVETSGVAETGNHRDDLSDVMEFVADCEPYHLAFPIASRLSLIAIVQ